MSASGWLERLSWVCLSRRLAIMKDEGSRATIINLWMAIIDQPMDYC